MIDYKFSITLSLISPVKETTKFTASGRSVVVIVSVATSEKFKLSFCIKTDTLYVVSAYRDVKITRLVLMLATLTVDP